MARGWACRHVRRVGISLGFGLPRLQGGLFALVWAHLCAYRQMKEPTPGKWRLLGRPSAARDGAGRARIAKTTPEARVNAARPVHVIDYMLICIFDFSQRLPARPQTCARSGPTTVPWPCPACTSWGRHAPLLHPTPAPSPPVASGYMHTSPQHHTSARKLAHGRPLGGAQPRGACKATRCTRSWQGPPRLTVHAAMA